MIKNYEFGDKLVIDPFALLSKNNKSIESLFKKTKILCFYSFYCLFLKAKSIETQQTRFLSKAH